MVKFDYCRKYVFVEFFQYALIVYVEYTSKDC